MCLHKVDMKKQYLAIFFVLCLLQPCCSRAQSDLGSFYQFLSNFNNQTTIDSLLTLQEIEGIEYHEELLDSLYSDFYNKTRIVGEGILSCNTTPSPINATHNSIPYFSSYATFRVDCSDGYLVCISHRFSGNIDLWFLEFISFDKNGTPTTRLFLPYMVNMSEKDNDYLAVMTKLYVSNSNLCYILDSYSNLNNCMDERIIYYQINMRGQLVCISDKKSKKSECLRSLGYPPPKHIVID